MLCAYSVRCTLKWRMPMWGCVLSQVPLMNSPLTAVHGSVHSIHTYKTSDCSRWIYK